MDNCFTAEDTFRFVIRCVNWICHLLECHYLFSGVKLSIRSSLTLLLNVSSGSLHFIGQEKIHPFQPSKCQVCDYKLK